MVRHIILKKGLDINLSGAAERRTVATADVSSVALRVADFRGLKPSLKVKDGAKVRRGDRLFVDSTHPQIRFCSPVAGTVSLAYDQGGALEEVRVVRSDADKCRTFSIPKLSDLTASGVKDLLLDSGLWPCIKQRPFGTLANPDITPKSIFISAFSSAPLAPDIEYAVGGEVRELQAGIDALALLTEGGVHYTMNAGNFAGSDLHKVERVISHSIAGPHPCGNVGVQINRISPLNAGDCIWTVDVHSVVAIGRFFMRGVLDLRRKIAVTGPSTCGPAYVNGICGMCLSDIPQFFPEPDSMDIISGDVLSGRTIGANGYLGFFDSQITTVPATPEESLTPRCWTAPMLPDSWKKVLPMDIDAEALFKAIKSGNTRKMVQLGLLEILEEDVALCEYVSPYGTNIMDTVTEGIDKLMKEGSYV